MTEFLFALMVGCSLCLAWTLTRNKRLKILAVIDGDTFEAVSQRGRRYRLRLKGCDCPEMDQDHGAAAASMARELLDQKWVDVRFFGKDKYRRHLVRIKADGKDVCEQLLGAGLAYPLPGQFSTAAILARFDRRGVWRSGFSKRPWEARSRNRSSFSWFLRRAHRALTKRGRR